MFAPNSTAENDFLTSLVNGAQNPRHPAGRWNVWLGITDREVAGQWREAHGDLVTFDEKVSDS